MMRYIYSGTIGAVPKSAKAAATLLNLADIYKLEPMGQMVLKKWRKSLNVSNCFEILDMTGEEGNQNLLQLKEIAEQHIVENLSSLNHLEMERLIRTHAIFSTKILRSYFEDEKNIEADRRSNTTCQIFEKSPLKVITQFSQMKLCDDLEKSLKITNEFYYKPIRPSCSTFDDEITISFERFDEGPGDETRKKCMIGADFKIVFYPSGFSFFCHKFLLVARSKVFRDMFMANEIYQKEYYGNSKIQQYKIELDFTNWDREAIHNNAEVTAHNMIKFIYTGTIDDVPLDTVRNHLHLVTTYKLDMMGPLVQKRLSDSLSASNCVQLLLLSLSDPILLELKEMAIQTIVNNLSTVTSFEEWENLVRDHPEITKRILTTYFMSPQM